MEQVSDDVRGIQRVRESRLSQGALLRAEVQGAESGQDVGGLLHQAVGFPCPVPLHRHELQAGEVYHRPYKAEPGDCRAFKGDGS